MIDIATHILPRKFTEAVERKSNFRSASTRVRPAIYDVEERLKIMAGFGEYSQVLTLRGPCLSLLGGPQTTPELARTANDEMVEIVARYPERFLAAVASLPLSNIEASHREMERAIEELGCKGIQLFTNINGKPLDTPEFLPLFETMGRYDLPIWIHPVRSAAFADYGTEQKSRYQAWFCFGFPYETSVAMTRIVFTGLFDRYPNLKIITHHLGGMAPYYEQRIRGTYDQYSGREQDHDDALDKLKHPPLEYFRMFYNDTAVYGSIPAVECALAFFGSERILFGTDFPCDAENGTRYLQNTIRSVEGITASREDKKKIFEDNARKLLHLMP